MERADPSRIGLGPSGRIARRWSRQGASVVGIIYRWKVRTRWRLWRLWGTSAVMDARACKGMCLRMRGVLLPTGRWERAPLVAEWQK